MARYRDPKTGKFISRESFNRRVEHVKRTIIARAGWETRRANERTRRREAARARRVKTRAKEVQIAQRITKELAFNATENELSPGFHARKSFEFDATNLLVKVTFRTPKYDRRVTGRILPESRPSRIVFKWSTVTHKRR